MSRATLTHLLVSTPRALLAAVVMLGLGHAACGDETDAGDASGGANVADCGACAMPRTEPGGACRSQYDACEADAGCASWNDCADACYAGDFTAGCFDGCASTYSAAATLFQPLLDCLCSACSLVCTPSCG